MAVDPGKLARECAVAGGRARSLRITGFRFAITGDVVTLDGEALTPEAIDSAGKLFAGTVAREVVNRIRHAPPDPSRPGAILSPRGYVQVVELGPHATRLVESTVWEVLEGDTIAAIAESVYGDPALADRIVQANASQLGPERFIRPGQRLKIPPR